MQHARTMRNHRNSIGWLPGQQQFAKVAQAHGMNALYIDIAEADAPESVVQRAITKPVMICATDCGFSSGGKWPQ